MKKSSGNRPQEPSGEEDRQATFERRRAVMQMFCDNAKTYIQLSLGALALTLTFTDRILHIPQTANIADGWMITVWVCFLITVVAGAFYQYLAVKLVEANVEWGYNDAWDWLQPGYVYAVMLIAFYGGTVIFTIYAIIRLRHP